MKLFVIIATIVACASAAPTAELQHPSPVNPNVLVEIKPQEKIVLITDPRELAKFKRETKQPLYPTVLPGDQVYYRTKRDVTQKPQEFQNPQLLPANLPVEEVITEKYSEPKSNHQIEIQNTNNDNRKKSQEDQENVEKNVTTEVYQKPQGLPAIFSPSNKAIQQQKRDIPVPLVAKHQHPEESPKEPNEKVTQQEKHDDQKVSEVFQKPQGLPAIFSPANGAAVQPQKRDIPVPLVPKYHHPEESPKELDNKESQEENKKELDNEKKHDDQTSPLKEDHVIVEGFQKPQTLPLILKDNHDETQHKRDIPVPLVPKYHHPEESPKETNEKEDHEEKKEVETENHQGPPIVLANNHEDHAAKLPLILKENSAETQHKRDIPVPLVPKYHHPEESPKESNENKKEIDSENHHVVAAQTLPAHNEDHVTAEGFQKPQTLPLILKDNHDDDTQHKRDIPVPLVPKYQHPEESPKESNEKEDHEEKKEVETENHQEPHQAHGNKHEDHVAKLPLILKANSAETQHKRDIPVPLVPKYDHPEESPKDINDKEDHQDRKENNNVPAHNQDHVNAEGYQKPQTLPLSLKEASENHHHVEEAPKEKNEKKSHDEDKNETNLENSQHHVSHIHHVAQTLPNHHHHEHVSFEAIHRPQVNHEHSSSNKHQEQTTQKDEEKIVDDAKTHHIQSQTLNGHIHHKHLAMEGLQKPQILPSHNNQEHIISTAALSHLPTHFSAEDLKQTHNSATVMGHQHEVNKNEGDHHPNRHEVQVEDLSDSKPFQQPIYNHAQPAVGDHKPNILDDHLSAHDFTTSTTTTTVPNILRHRPVPVAELFARAHGN